MRSHQRPRPGLSWSRRLMVRSPGFQSGWCRFESGRLYAHFHSLVAQRKSRRLLTVRLLVRIQPGEREKTRLESGLVVPSGQHCSVAVNRWTAVGRAHRHIDPDVLTHQSLIKAGMLGETVRHCSKHLEAASFMPSGKCRQCNKEYQRKWFLENRQTQSERSQAMATKAFTRNQTLYWEYLSLHPCVDCGETDQRVLEADHVTQKFRSIAKLLRNNSWERILSELQYCEIRCANCHRRKTYERASTWRHTFFNRP